MGTYSGGGGDDYYDDVCTADASSLTAGHVILQYQSRVAQVFTPAAPPEIQ